MALIGSATAALGHFALGAFPSFGEALWSSIAHLVDPGSIGDDDTAAERAIGLVQVLAGIVFFAGVVLTVLTEVVDRALRRLQKGDPAVRRRGHLLIVGFSPSLWEVQDHLRATLGPSPPEIVVMLPLAEMERRGEARRALAGYPARTAVVAADPGEDGYARVCAAAARGIVLLSPAGPADAADLEATDRAILLHRHLERPPAAAPPVAVEMRRERNVRAFWFDGAGSPGAAPRFPANFDALVKDRNIGAILSLAVNNPGFAAEFLDRRGTEFSLRLIAPAADGGLTFGEVRDRLDDHNLLGIVSGAGPQAEVAYLPGPERPLREGDRLIVTPRERPPGRPSAAAAGEPAPIAPADPGHALMIGWSDASRALVEDLEASGRDPARLHLLDREAPAAPGRSDRRPPFEVLIGDPGEPADIAAAISRVRPRIVWVAARDGDEAGAIIAGMLARQLTGAPVLVEGVFADRAQREERVASGLDDVSTAGIVAEAVAASLHDPAILVARERMLADPAVRLESLVYTGSGPVAIGELPELLKPARAVPLTASTNGEGVARVRPGDEILALRRAGPEPADPEPAG